MNKVEEETGEGVLKKKLVFYVRRKKTQAIC